MPTPTPAQVGDRIGRSPIPAQPTTQPAIREKEAQHSENKPYTLPPWYPPTTHQEIRHSESKPYNLGGSGAMRVTHDRRHENSVGELFTPPLHAPSLPSLMDAPHMDFTDQVQGG